MSEANVTICRLPVGQSVDLFTSIGQLLHAALAQVGEAMIEASSTPGTACSILIAGTVPERQVIAALRASAAVLDGTEPANLLNDDECDHGEDDPRMTVNQVRAEPDGGLSFGLGGPEELASAMAQRTMDAYLPYLRHTEAPNYLAWQVVDRDTGDEYEISITKPNGLTPHVARQRAEAEVERLLTLLADHDIDPGSAA